MIDDDEIRRAIKLERRLREMPEETQGTEGAEVIMAHKNNIPASQSSGVARKICPKCKKEVMNSAYCRRYDTTKGKTAWVKIGYYCPGCGHFVKGD